MGFVGICYCIGGINTSVLLAQQYTEINNILEFSRYLIARMYGRD